MITKYFFPSILLALFSHSVQASYDGELNPMGCTFDDMQQFYVSELGIGNNVIINHVRQRMPDPRTKGFTKPLANGEYLIAMAKALEPSEIRITLAHELVHVRQLERGEIKQEEFKKYYLDRNFEDEAFRLSLPLAAKFYTQHTCKIDSKKSPAQ